MNHMIQKKLKMEVWLTSIFFYLIASLAISNKIYFSSCELKNQVIPKLNPNTFIE
jgi:hypothetical protein